MTGGRLAYRAGQFVRAFALRWRPQERAELEGLLSSGELAIFYGMRASAQRHGLAVYRNLQRQGVEDRDLLAASLLHDVGKGRLSLAYRVAVVVLEAVWPELLEGLAAPSGRWWGKGFYEQIHHEELGAELARQAGSSPLLVDLIRHHHQAGGQGPPGLAALRTADEGA